MPGRSQTRYAARISGALCLPFAAGVYNPLMPKRTSPIDAGKISVAADLEALVQDKREGWRSSGATARRRQRRYKALLTQQLLRLGPAAAGETALDDDA